MTNHLPSKSECRRTIGYVNDILEYAIEYGERKHFWSQLTDEMEQFIERNPESEETFCQHFAEVLLPTTVFCHSKRIASFLRTVRKELPDEHLSLIRKWKKQPWFFCAFKVQENLGDSLFRVEPLGDPPAVFFSDTEWEKITIFSPLIEEEYLDGCDLFIGLLFQGRFVYHLSGDIVPLKGYSENDIFSYADQIAYLEAEPELVPLKGMINRTTKVSDVISQNPGRFYDFWNYYSLYDMPVSVLKMENCVSVVTVNDDIPIEDESFWASAFAQLKQEPHIDFFEGKVGRVDFYSSSLPEDPVLFISLITKRLFLSCYTIEGYVQGREIMQSICSFPEVPQVYTSFGMFFVQKSLTGRTDLFDRILKITGDFDADSIGQIVEEQIPYISNKDLKDVLNHFIKNMNNGITESDQKIATYFAVPVFVVERVRNIFEEKVDTFGFSVFEKKDALGLTWEDVLDLNDPDKLPHVTGKFEFTSAEKMWDSLQRSSFDEKEYLRGVPILRFTNWLFNKLSRKGTIVLTEYEMVPDDLIKEAFQKDLLHYDHKLREEKYQPPDKEIGWPLFHGCRVLFEDIGIIEKKDDALVITETGKCLQKDLVQMYKTIIDSFFIDYTWNYFITEELAGPIRYFAGSFLYILGRLFLEKNENIQGNEEVWIEITEILDVLFHTNPEFEKIFDEIQIESSDSYHYSSLEKILYYEFFAKVCEIFGLVKRKSNRNNYSVSPSELFFIVFKIQ